MKNTKSIIVLFITSMFALGCGGGDGKTTRSGGELYEELMTADCEALQGCGLLGGFTFDQCVDLKVNEACNADLAACAMEYDIPDSEWDACLDAMLARDCPSIEVGLIPSECLTINELF